MTAINGHTASLNRLKMQIVERTSCVDALHFIIRSQEWLRGTEMLPENVRDS